MSTSDVTRHQRPPPDCGGAGEPPCSWLAVPRIDFVGLGFDPIDFFWGIYDARYGDLDDDGRMEIVAVNQNVGTSVVATALQVPSVADGFTATAGADVTLEAGETIRLADGFTAAAGSELVARIF